VTFGIAYVIHVVLAIAAEIVALDAIGSLVLDVQLVGILEIARSSDFVVNFFR
jgi:hypothetical protein